MSLEKPKKKKVKLMSDFFKSKEEKGVERETILNISKPSSSTTAKEKGIHHTSEDTSISVLQKQISEDQSTSVSGTFVKNDIGIMFANGQRDLSLINRLNDFEKKEFLINHWTPSKWFKFPYSEKGGNNPQKAYLSWQHISGEKNLCFKYSPSLKGLLCILCVLFVHPTSENNRKKTTNLSQLVNKPLSKYIHLTGKDGYQSEHLKKDHHKTSQSFSDTFIHAW